MPNSIIFSLLSKICLDDEQSWAGKIFLTFDIDWAHDDILQDTLELVLGKGVKSTWFVTHKTGLLNDLKQYPDFELGIHPNFNSLLNGESNTSSIGIIENCLSIVPEARAVRSHSLTQSERLVDQFLAAGLTHISNFFIPYGCGVQVRPYRIWNGAIIVPHSWQDNVALKMKVPFPKNADFDFGLHVFDFHPIHVFLNTESLDHYERTRPMHRNPKELIKHRYEGYGTRSRLIELLELSKQP